MACFLEKVRMLRAWFWKNQYAKGMVLEKLVCQRHGFGKVSMPAAYERIERNDL